MKVSRSTDQRRRETSEDAPQARPQLNPTPSVVVG
jgi:hypothetical protein